MAVLVFTLDHRTRKLIIARRKKYNQELKTMRTLTHNEPMKEDVLCEECEVLVEDGRRVVRKQSGTGALYSKYYHYRCARRLKIV